MKLKSALPASVTALTVSGLPPVLSMVMVRLTTLPIALTPKPIESGATAMLAGWQSRSAAS